MYLIIIITCNFLAGLAVAEFVYRLQPDFWKYMFEKHPAIEADEMQDAWYNNEQVIYFIIIVLGYPFMLFILYCFILGRIRKIVKKFKG